MNMELTWINLLLSTIYVKCLIMGGVMCDWTYVNTTVWGKTWKNCAKMQQSPINIIDSDAAALINGVVLNGFENFNTSFDVTLTNNGRTVKLELLSDHNVSLRGNRLYVDNLYKLKEVHFHWGSTRRSGSEHKVDGKSASMEIHLVHFNQKYSSFETAREETNGILVLSVLVDVSTDVSLNSFWRSIYEALAFVPDPGNNRKIRNITFGSFLPRNMDDFYLYRGSFSTPPCLETVTWVVFRERLLIPAEYLEGFMAVRTNMSGHLGRLASNIRPVQPLNMRTILKTFHSTQASKDFEIRVFEKVIQGKVVVGVLKLYDCHVPSFINLAIIIPAADVVWKSENLTSDIRKPVPLDKTKPYGVTLVDMHDHPKGTNKDTLHVIIKLNDMELTDIFLPLRKDCLKDSCSWSRMGKSKTCTLRLIDTDEQLSFTLTRKCDVYESTIKTYDDVVFKTTMGPHSRVKVVPRAKNQQLNDTLSRWYLLLVVDTDNNTRSAKLSAYIPYSSRSRAVVLVEGLYDHGETCSSSSDGTPDDHVRLIVGVAVGVFVLTVIILTVCLIWRKIKNTAKPTLLEEEVEQDTTAV